MPRQPSADGSPRRKTTFGGAKVDRFKPALGSATPKAINCIISFEEALKLHLSLGQLLGHLNGYDRSTKAGKRCAVNLCVHVQHSRIVVVEDKLSIKPKRKGEPTDGEASE